MKRKITNLLPVENVVYRTKLSYNEVVDRICENTRYELTGKEFDDNIFYIKRVIYYQNSFLPRIKGVIIVDDEWTVINVEMKPHMLVTIFTLLWLGGIGIYSLFSLLASVTKGFNPFLLMSIGMLIVICIMFWGAFKFESRKSRKDLQQILEAEII